MIGFKTAFRSRSLSEQRPERATMHTHNALVLADPDAECDAVSVGIPVRIRRKGEEHRDLLDREDVRIMFSYPTAECNVDPQAAGLRFVISPDTFD